MINYYLIGVAIIVLCIAIAVFFSEFFTAFERAGTRPKRPDYRNDDPYEIVPINYNAPAPPAPEYVAFNLNDAIKVKLTDEGVKVLKGTLYTSVKDKDGYYEFQGWVFIKLFGPHVRIDKDLFAAAILIRSKDITAVKKSTF